ncbi:protein TALPID3 [Danio aesculapii]|uniref:protein TALPID3 n=1 Tax=Danio aesculapii TaxID=1142201 RepID=UPI0024BF33BB|nr:protein TALPID3 [Danio aesculapii]
MRVEMDSCVSVNNKTQFNDSTSSSDAADVLIHSTRASRDEIKHKSQKKVNIYIRRLSDSEHVRSVDERRTDPPVNVPSVSDTAGPEEQQAGSKSNQFAGLFGEASRKEKREAQSTIMQTEQLKSKGEDVQISTYSADGRGAVSAALRKRSQGAPLRRNVTVQVLEQDRSQTPRVQPDPACPLGDPGTSASVAAITAATIAATAPLIKAQSEMEAQISLVSAELRRLQAAEGSVLPGRTARIDSSSAGRAAHLEEQLNILIQQRLQHLETIQCQQIQLQNRLLGSALDVVASRGNTNSQSSLHTSSGVSQTDSFPLQVSGNHSIRSLATDNPSARRPASVSKDPYRERQTGGHKSPLETPAPRKVIPKPTHWTSTSTNRPPKSSFKNQGNGRLQDQSPNNRRSPERCALQSVGVKRFAMATADNSQPEQSRESQMPSKASVTRSAQEDESSFLNGQNEHQGEPTNVSSSSTTVQKASEMLQDLGRLKNEMRSLLQTADAFPAPNAKSTQSSRSRHLAPVAMAPPPATTPISMPPEPVDAIAVRAAALNRASILKSIQPPTSIFEDAGLVLRQVRQSKKILEENLEAILRAKDGEVLHTQLEALSKNSGNCGVAHGNGEESLSSAADVRCGSSTDGPRVTVKRKTAAGKPRLDCQPPVPSRVIITDKPAIVTTSFNPITVAESKPTPAIRKPNTILLEVQSASKKRTPQLQIQVQPGVNIESALCSRPASPTPVIPAESILPPPSIHATEDPHAHEDQEENIFPGTNFLAEADISQETHGGLPDSPIEFKGLPSPPAALYHGPVFPPVPTQSTPLTEPILNTIQQRETLENRLVDWVEQQVMARVITGMFPQPTQADPPHQSEPENSVASDIVEAAGGGGLQLFVDTGVPVDSEVIRHYVNEVLTEIIASMLGQREAQGTPTAPVQTQDDQKEDTIVPTPAPTPEPSLKDPPSPVRTPDLSEHLSTAASPKKTPQESALPGPDRIPVGTPITTPIPSPTRVATPSPPPPANQSPEPGSLQIHLWEGSELPLEEEEQPELQPAPVVISVPRVDDEESVIHPSSPVPSKPQSPPAPPLPPVIQKSESSSSSSSSSSESSCSSSVTVTETETAARHISEGELLLNHGQMAAVRVLEQEGVLLPNFMTSLNGSLHGVQDMDYDPPSEGQVIRAPHLPAHHDPVLSLLARMELGPTSQSQQPERWWEEESSGEVSEGQRPPLTTAEEIVLTGHSLIDQQTITQARNTQISPHATLTSPGQVIAEHTGAVVEDDGLSVNLRSSDEQKEAMVYQADTVSSHQPESSQMPQTVHRPAPILVRQYEEEPEFPQLRRLSDDAFFGADEKGEDMFLHTGGGRGSDVRVMSVRLPSVKQDPESVSLSSVEGDTASSANDVF